MISLRRIFNEYRYNNTLPSSEHIIALRNSSFSTAFDALYEEREIKTTVFDKILKEAYSKQGAKKKKKKNQSSDPIFTGISSPYTPKDKKFINKLYRGTIAFFNLDLSKNKKMVTDIDSIQGRLYKIVNRAGPKRLSPIAKSYLLNVIGTSANLGQMVFLLGMAANV